MTREAAALDAPPGRRGRRPSTESPRRDLALLVALFLLVAAIRVTAPTDLATGDQPLDAAYVRDIVQRDAWLVQRDDEGRPASKPPLFNWLAALSVIAAGRQSDFALKLPSLLAGLATLALTWWLARRVATPRAALFAGVFLLCSTMYTKHVYFARTDMLLTLFVVAQFCAALRGQPVVFAMAAALAVLSKGPIGVVIPVIAIGAYWWWNGRLRERFIASRAAWMTAAVILPMAIWFVAAVWFGGPDVWDELVVRETLDRFGSGSKSFEHRHVAYYLPHLLVRMAPPSFLAVAALFSMRWSRREPQEPIAIAAWWLVAPLLFLSLVPSKRADRLFPLLPAVCILAGWAADRWFAGEQTKGVGGTLRGLSLFVAGAGLAVAIAGAAGLDAIDAALRSTAMLGGTLVAAAGIAMLLALARRRAGWWIGATAAAMIVIIGLYQHRFSEPARPATHSKSTARTSPSSRCTTHRALAYTHVSDPGPWMSSSVAIEAGSPRDSRTRPADSPRSM